MMTVKEISELTGISVRTLHYYDEIGLFVPTRKSEAGYRLYDDKALVTLQQILFFREFDIPLKKIKDVIENPAFDRNQILQMQRKMLVEKRERVERLIASIDDILKGENKMDFEVFNKNDLEKLFQHTLENMPEKVLEAIVKEFGSIEQWRENYLEKSLQETMQKGYQKMIEWYGSKDKAMKVLLSTPEQKLIQASQKQSDVILEKLSKKRNCSLDSFEVKELVGEYEFILGRLYQLTSEEGLKQLMLSVASSYRHELVNVRTDEQYGDGTAEFFAQAIENFYKG